jgi:predicted negative regulator of RcsB-dependent stress response
VFLKKLFNFRKDFSYYQEKGDRYFSAERFADARDAFSEALEKIDRGDNNNISIKISLRDKLAECGNRLGRLNLTEAEHALNNGDLKKAGEHLHIVLELAEEPALREKAENMLAGTGTATACNGKNEATNSCGSCKGDHDNTGHDEDHGIDPTMHMEDRFALYIHTLPEDLPKRYGEMGEKFARGCLLNLDGNVDGALTVFEELSAEGENDILDYEKAIIYYHKGDSRKCENLLKKALEFNGYNPLCYIGLVQLYTEIGRGKEALPLLERMISADLVPDQARMMLGDVYMLLQDESMAVECFKRLLSSPGVARQAAERLIPMLEKQGRSEEAAYLAKKFAKGCS